MMKKKIFAIIPGYNEGKHVGEVIANVKKYVDNIIVVDDGSKDDTSLAAEKEKVFVLKHIINMGKGAAMKTGCDFALSKAADVIIAIDADGQHEPAEIPNFVSALEGADIVFGYRKLSGKMPFVLRFGNWFISKSARLLYGVDLHDTQCGYRAFTSLAYKKIRWRALDYSMESEMIANTGKHKLRYKEIPIQTIYSDKYKGTTVIDGVKIVFNMFLWKIKGKKGALKCF